MYKGYKVRLFPTKEQEEKLWKHVHSCRFIWNYMLNLQEENYKNGLRHMSSYDMIRHLTTLKQNELYSWLYEVSNSSLQIVCSDLGKSYEDFFSKKNKKPKFKSRKRSKITFPICNERMFYKNGTVNIQKVGRMSIDFDLSGKKIINSRVSYVNNKWILSFSYECDNQALKAENDKCMGIDLGVKELAVVSYGNEKIVFGNINKSKKIVMLEHKFNHIQRVISRKYKAHNNYLKTKNIIKYEKIANEILYKISNIRRDYIHKTTHYLTNLRPNRVVMETLNVNGMMKNRHLAKAIQGQCFYEFIRQMKYKCEWNGIEFIQTDRWFPSSKMCSCCGNIKKDLKLSDRVYKCECGLEIDRDYNAAINLMRYVSH